MGEFVHWQFIVTQDLSIDTVKVFRDGRGCTDDTALTQSTPLLVIHHYSGPFNRHCEGVQRRENLYM